MNKQHEKAVTLTLEKVNGLDVSYREIPGSEDENGKLDTVEVKSIPKDVVQLIDCIEPYLEGCAQKELRNVELAQVLGFYDFLQMKIGKKTKKPKDD